MLTSIRDYEKFVYSVQGRYPIVDGSSVGVRNVNKRPPPLHAAAAI
jgi:hypothetical protein